MRYVACFFTVVFVFALAVFGCSSEQERMEIEKKEKATDTPVNPQDTVCIDDDCFFVEIADTQEKRAQGLMNREKMDDDRGMFFIFEEENIYPFWMKNTLIPLDIIWIDSNYEVVYIGENVQPCREEPCPLTTPNDFALYVLEVNAGIVERIGLGVGDKIAFNPAED